MTEKAWTTQIQYPFPTTSVFLYAALVQITSCPLGHETNSLYSSLQAMKKTSFLDILPLPIVWRRSHSRWESRGGEKLAIRDTLETFIYFIERQGLCG